MLDYRYISTMGALRSEAERARPSRMPALGARRTGRGALTREAGPTRAHEHGRAWACGRWIGVRTSIHAFTAGTLCGVQVRLRVCVCRGQQRSKRARVGH